MKKPYIKKYGKVSGFKIYLVDGKYIRSNMNEEFTNCGQHYQFKFIPKDELWLDREAKKGEKKFYINSMIRIERFLREEMSHENALRKANSYEIAEREKSKLMKKEIQLKKYPNKLMKSIHKKLLREYSNRHIKIWIVSGEEVRDLFFIDFTEGGHGYVYNFIPKDEVWIDDDLEKSEIKFVLLHELHERRLMKDKKMDYNTAHFRSSHIEYSCRKNPKMLDKKLKKEIEKNK